MYFSFFVFQDLVKSHLMFAVREEVVVLKDKIGELMERISQLEYENNVLRQYATQETLQQIQQHHSSNTWVHLPSILLLLLILSCHHSCCYSCYYSCCWCCCCFSWNVVMTCSSSSIIIIITTTLQQHVVVMLQLLLLLLLWWLLLLCMMTYWSNFFIFSWIIPTSIAHHQGVYHISHILYHRPISYIYKYI